MALFNGTTAQFRQFVPGLTINYSLDDVRHQLDAVILTLLPQFLGDATTDQLIALAADESALDTPDNRYKKRALYLARVAVARIGFARYLPFAEVQIGDDGVTITAIEGRKAAFEYQTRKLERNLLDEGWRALDELISLVASQAATFSDWPDSPYYQQHQDALFKNAAEFSKYYPIQDRWLTFWALRPFIQAVEEDRGRPALVRIGAVPDTVTEPQITKLKGNLLRALAYQSVIEAIPNLSVELNGANVQVNYASQYANIGYFQPPGKDLLEWVLGNLKKQAELAWSTFETALLAVQPDTGTDSSTDAGLIYSTGAVTML